MCGNITERSVVFLKALVMGELPHILPDTKMKGSGVTHRKGEAPLSAAPLLAAQWQRYRKGQLLLL